MLYHQLLGNGVKAITLPTLLEGEALAVWLELSDEDKKDYKKTKEHLCKSMNKPLGRGCYP